MKKRSFGPQVVSKEPYKLFGKHLTLDAYGISKAKLSSHRAIFDLLNELPENLGMRKLTTPYVVFCDEGEKSGDWGVSGFVMIYESHISVHTWPALGYVSMDLYSCREFDEKKTEKYLKKFWKWKRANVRVVGRG